MSGLSWFPRSYAAALIGAFALVIAPLAIALGHATLQLYGLAERSEASVARAAELGTAARGMREAVLEIERTTRQAEVLGTAQLRETYLRQVERLEAAAAQITRAAPGPDAERLRSTMKAAIDGISDAFRRGHAIVALDLLPNLSQASAGLEEYAQDILTRERAALAARPGEVSAEFALIAALAVPLALALAAVFAWRLGFPVRRLGTAMRRLGEGDLTTAVAVDGPREIAQLGAGLEWLRQRLVMLENARERFLRGVSHDLKTPIAAIAEGGALLGDELYGTLSSKQHAVVELITQNAARLLERIETMLRAASMSPAAAPSLGEPVDLASVARAALEDSRLALEHRSLKTQVELVAAPVLGDAERLRIVIDNVLSNAIKVSPGGGVISVTLSTDGEVARLEVADQGPGLAPGEEEMIFRLGTRGSAAFALGTRGSGQGLAIAREFAELYGGKLFAAPSHHGARFVLLLPLAPTVEKVQVAHA
jgi:two-component system, NtrC family, sensor histidine kinase GlrK